MNTPWGPSQHVTPLVDGVFEVDTAGHGGLGLDAAAYKSLPANIRKGGEKQGPYYWFEEDCAFGLVMVAHPDWYRIRVQRSLDHWALTMRNPPDWAIKDGPAAIAKLQAKLLLPDNELIAELVESNRQWFPELFGLGPRCENCNKLNCPGHDHDLIVLSARSGESDGVPAGQVGVTCCYGGRKGNGYASAELYYLIPAEEYAARDTGGCTIVDPSRHPVWNKENHATKQTTIGEMFSAAAI